MNVFLEMVHSVYDFKSYGLFLKDKNRKTFLFGFLLVFIYFLITIIVPFVRFEASTGGIMNVIDQIVPDFTIENSTVSVARQVEYDNGDMYIFVDTKEGPIDDTVINDYLRSYNRVLIMDSERAVIKNSRQIQEIFYKDLDPELFMTKVKLFESLTSTVAIVVAISMIVIFVGMELLFFFGVLFVGLLGMIVASCMQAPLTFGQLYKLGVYTRTTPLLIKALLSFLPFGIPFYTMISIGISLYYLSGAIRYMKASALANGPLSFSSNQTGPIQNIEDQNGQGSWNRPNDDYDRWNRPYDG